MWGEVRGSSICQRKLCTAQTTMWMSRNTGSIILVYLFASTRLVLTLNSSRFSLGNTGLALVLNEEGYKNNVEHT